MEGPESESYGSRVPGVKRNRPTSTPAEVSLELEWGGWLPVSAEPDIGSLTGKLLSAKRNDSLSKF